MKNIEKPFDGIELTSSLFHFYNKKRRNKSAKIVLSDELSDIKDQTGYNISEWFTDENLKYNSDRGCSLLYVIVEAAFAFGIEQGMRIHSEQTFKETPDLIEEEIAVKNIVARLAQLRKDGHIK